MGLIKNDLNEIISFFKDGWDHFKNKNLLITGGTGFFGKTIVSSLIHANNLLDLKCNIFIITRKENLNSKYYGIEDNYSALNFICSDIISFSNKIDNIDYIIHGASTYIKAIEFKSPKDTLETILIGTKNILEFAKDQKNLKSLLIISSGAIYGTNKHSNKPISENDYHDLDLNDDLSSYSLGKKTAELYSLNYMSEYNLPIKIVRCFTVAGPLMNFEQKLAFTSFISSYRNSKNITVQNKNTLRSYMYSTDLINWLFKVLVFSENGSIYNVGSDEQITMGILAKKIAAYNPNIEVFNNSIDQANMYVPNIQKIKNDLNLEINIKIDESISRVIKYLNN